MTLRYERVNEAMMYPWDYTSFGAPLGKRTAGPSRQYTSGQLYEMARQQAQVNPKIASVLYAKAQALAGVERLASSVPQIPKGSPESFRSLGVQITLRSDGLPIAETLMAFVRSTPVFLYSSPDLRQPIGWMSEGTLLVMLAMPPGQAIVRVGTSNGLVGYVDRTHLSLRYLHQPLLYPILEKSPTPAMTFSER